LGRKVRNRVQPFQFDDIARYKYLYLPGPSKLQYIR
jgi:hypothetical protein